MTKLCYGYFECHNFSIRKFPTRIDHWLWWVERCENCFQAFWWEKEGLQFSLSQWVNHWKYKISLVCHWERSYTKEVEAKRKSENWCDSYFNNLFNWI